MAALRSTTGSCRSSRPVPAPAQRPYEPGRGERLEAIRGEPTPGAGPPVRGLEFGPAPGTAAATAGQQGRQAVENLSGQVGRAGGGAWCRRGRTPSVLDEIGDQQRDLAGYAVGSMQSTIGAGAGDEPRRRATTLRNRTGNDAHRPAGNTGPRRQAVQPKHDWRATRPSLVATAQDGRGPAAVEHRHTVVQPS